MSLFLLLLVECIFVSYLDIRYRQVNNGYLLFILLTGIVILIEQHRIPDINSIFVSSMIILVGILASFLKVLGAADSKLLAIWGILISSKQLLLFGFFTAIISLFSCLLFYLIIYFKPVLKSSGLPLIPAISLSGLFCLWLS
ncbi:MAG: hypothetical protein CENE_03572 [Candidatus Celerinatantimonas neptuna]|nr:MAG: hypothetical protein CENE_03572 [Candidatus Celerinatantimonas neptuna]